MIDPPRRLVFTTTETRLDGSSFDTELEFTFEEEAGKTRVTLRYEGVPPGTERDGAQQGWSESLECLGEYLAKA